MPSNHISNKPYHDWLLESYPQRERARRENEAKSQYQVMVLPSKSGRGWEMRVIKGKIGDLDDAPSMVAESDDDLPVVLRRLYAFLNSRQDDPPLAD